MIQKYSGFLLGAYLSLSMSPAFAEFQRAKEMLTRVEEGLRGLSLVTVTISVLWVGYKVLFGGSTISECAPIIIGAILIASAAEVARLLVG